MSRTPPSQSATSTPRADSSHSAPERFMERRGATVTVARLKHGRGQAGGSNHDVFATEDDPEAEECGVEDALSHVLQQQHPGPLEAQREPLDRDVQERHGDTQSEDDSEDRHGLHSLLREPGAAGRALKNVSSLHIPPRSIVSNTRQDLEEEKGTYCNVRLD